MKYANAYARSGRPNYYIWYWCPVQQKTVWEATPFKLVDPQGRRKAYSLAQQKSKAATAYRVGGTVERWEAWAVDFLKARYKGREKTLPRMVGAWEQWNAFLNERDISAPRALDYNGVLDFISWRSAQVKTSGKTVSKNTALCDVKAMSVVMREAIRRGFAETNPCEKLGIQKDPPKEKRPLREDEIAYIRFNLMGQEEWMRTAFEIAIYHGCRIMEAQVALEDVHLEFTPPTIMFRGKGKNGLAKIHTVPLHPKLVPMMERFKAEGRKFTCELPELAPLAFWKFFRFIGLEDISIHCTRVTVVTTFAQKGIPVQQAMAYVNHSSKFVHAVYTKLAAQDLGRATAAINF